MGCLANRMTGKVINMPNLKMQPFNLDDEAVVWVKETLRSLTEQEKVSQLFCLAGFSQQEEALKEMAGRGIGGVMYRQTPGKLLQQSHRTLQKHAKIPLLLAANLESGGNGAAAEGTPYGNPMQAAATGDREAGYKLGKVACSEGAAVGCNWTFAPVVDIDMNFHNPITNLRTFGHDPDRVLHLARGYLKAADEEEVAVSIKHFPGDGVDERDQHTLVPINSLSVDEWDQTFGKVYSGLIQAGAKTVMVGHIALPSWAHKINPSLPQEDNTPASLSPELLQGLLRERLGFNGLIVTDATLMLGFMGAMPRSKGLPFAVAAGCDMLLFTKSFEEDYGYVMAALEDGRLSRRRLDEAVTRILALKASLGLHRKQKAGKLVPPEEALSVLGCQQHKAWEEACARQAVTLVKDNQGLLPLLPDKHRRVYLNVIEASTAIDTPLKETLKQKLEDEGFQVTVRDRETSINLKALNAGGDPDPRVKKILEELTGGIEDFRSQYDLVMYVANMETVSNNTTVRLQWIGLGNDAPWFVHEVPTLFVSLANPYHLLDAPMMQTFINAYSSTEAVIDAVVDKLTGKEPFTGISPIDPFCGRWDTKL